MAIERDIQINLLNYKLGPQIERRQKIIAAAVYLAIGILLLSTMAFLYMDKRAQLTRALAVNKQLKQSLSSRNNVISGVLNDEKIKTALYSRQQMVEQVENDKHSYSEMFQDLNQMKLSGVLITNINAQAGNVDFNGFINPPSDLVDVTGWFYQSERFGNIRKINTQLNSETGETDFELSVSWKEAAR